MHTNMIYIEGLIRRNILGRQDAQIDKHNKRLKIANNARMRAEGRLLIAELQAAHDPTKISGLDKAVKALNKARELYRKALAGSAAALKTGSGQVGVLLPPGYQPSLSDR